MKTIFVVAENAFTVSAPDGLPAWEALMPRYDLFAAEAGATPVLEVEIRPGRMPREDAERIYEPVHSGISSINARASRQADGALVMEFKLESERRTRLWLRMSPEFDKGEIFIDSDDADDRYILTHALMIALMLAVSGRGTLLIHASTVVCDGRAYLFQGKSGTGKSTHAALWTRNIDGAELLNDDHPLIRFTEEDVAMAYGSPWSGKTHCYRNASAPVGAFVRIVRAQENRLRRLAPLNAYASLTASVSFMPFMSEKLRDARHKAIERLAATIPCCEMRCLPNADAARVCHAALRPGFTNPQ